MTAIVLSYALHRCEDPERPDGFLVLITADGGHDPHAAPWVLLRRNHGRVVRRPQARFGDELVTARLPDLYRRCRGWACTAGGRPCSGSGVSGAYEWYVPKVAEVPPSHASPLSEWRPSFGLNDIALEIIQDDGVASVTARTAGAGFRNVVIGRSTAALHLECCRIAAPAATVDVVEADLGVVELRIGRSATGHKTWPVGTTKVYTATRITSLVKERRSVLALPVGGSDDHPAGA